MECGLFWCNNFRRAAIFFVASTATLPGLPTKETSPQQTTNNIWEYPSTPRNNTIHLYIYICSINYIFVVCIYIYNSMLVSKTWKFCYIETCSSPLPAFESFGLDGVPDICRTWLRSRCPPHHKNAQMASTLVDLTSHWNILCESQLFPNCILKNLRLFSYNMNSWVS